MIILTRLPSTKITRANSNTDPPMEEEITEQD